MDKKKDILTDLYRNRFKNYQLPVDDEQLWMQLEPNLPSASSPSGTSPDTSPSTEKLPAKLGFGSQMVTFVAVAMITTALTVSLLLKNEKTQENPQPQVADFAWQEMPAIHELGVIASEDSIDLHRSPERHTSFHLNQAKPVDNTAVVAPVSNGPHSQGENNVVEQIQNTGTANEKLDSKAQPEPLVTGMGFGPGKDKGLSFKLLLGSLLIYNTDKNDTGIRNEDNSLPLNLGLLVQKDLGKRWGIESGLIYSQMKSEGTEVSSVQNDAGAITDQFVNKSTRVSYLGLPVKVNYYLFRTPRLSVYALAGGMVEKNIYAKEDISTMLIRSNGNGSIQDPVGSIPGAAFTMESWTEEQKGVDVKTSRMQWSLMGNLGIDVKITGRLGVFLEPRIIYYFDNHSGTDSYRENHPFNFDLQGGLRLKY